jgi:hypothetical protein
VRFDFLMVVKIMGCNAMQADANIKEKHANLESA